MAQQEQITACAPPRPDMRCAEHGSLCEVIHSLHARVMKLEAIVHRLERTATED